MRRHLGWKVRTVCAALALPLLLWLVSFARLARWIYRSAAARSPAPPEADLAEWTDSLLRSWPPPWRYTCLKRGVVLSYLLHKAGRPATLHIGVRRSTDGSFAAHAWLTREEALLFEPPSSRPEEYRVIASFPEPKAATG